MDRGRMDADGGRVVHRERRTRKLAVVVAVQNVLVTACLVVTLYVCWDVQSRAQRAEQASEDTVHIQFSVISDISENVTLQFNEVHSSNVMTLADENDKIYIKCTGPYVLYMDLCYLGQWNDEATGTLQLQVAERQTPLSSFTLHASGVVCRGLHSIVFLRRKEVASLHLYSTNGFKIKNVTVGLSYLLGSRCEFW